MESRQTETELQRDDCSTIEAARWLGMAVRSVQLMVDRGELQAWKTPGGHRRISRTSIQDWLSKRAAKGNGTDATAKLPSRPTPRLLLIEDSVHFQSLVSLLVKQALPKAELHVADDGIAGLAMAGKLEPQLLIVDILLPGIDGATLITSLRSHPQFSSMALIVVTSLEEDNRQPYEFALQGVPVIHKTRLVNELPAEIRSWGLRAGYIRDTD